MLITLTFVFITIGLLFWNQLLIRFYFLVFFQKCILLGLQQQVSNLHKLSIKRKGQQFSVLKRVLMSYYLPYGFLAKKWGRRQQLNVADVKDHLLLRLRLYHAFAESCPARDWRRVPFPSHGKLAQGLSLTIRPTKSASPDENSHSSHQKPGYRQVPVRIFYTFSAGYICVCVLLFFLTCNFSVTPTWPSTPRPSPWSKYAHGYKLTKERDIMISEPRDLCNET